MESDYLFKIVIIGDSGVGKSSLLLRFVDDIFTESFISTIGVDFKIRTVEINGKVIKLQLWDTGGQERFRVITSTYYRNAHGIILVYDISDLESFTRIRSWIAEVEKYAGPNIPMIIIGNKSDLESKRLVSKEEAANLAKNYNCQHFETSAKNDSGVETAFLELTKFLVAKNQLRVNNPKDIIFTPNGSKIPNTKTCC